MGEDVHSIALQIAAALSMPIEERRARWHEILRGSFHTWFSDFMRAMKSTRPDAASPVRVKLPTLHQGEPALTAAYR
jgi:trehalose-6-phosphate synthase